jgi:hypothetical protein
MALLEGKCSELEAQNKATAAARQEAVGQADDLKLKNLAGKVEQPPVATKKWVEPARTNRF